MHPIRLAGFALLVVASGCAMTPREKCEAPYRAQLRVVSADMRETREALARGYRLVPARNDIGLHFCLRPSGMAHLCRAEDGEPMFDKQPIVRRAERAKLEALEQEYARLEQSIAACAAQYPQQSGG